MSLSAGLRLIATGIIEIANSIDVDPRVATSAIVPAQKLGAKIFREEAEVKAEPKAEPVKAVKAEPTPPAPAPEPSEDATAQLYAECMSAVKNIFKAKGGPALLDMLTPFGAKRLPEVPKERLAEFLAVAKKSLS